MIVLEAIDLAKEYRGGDGGTITILDGVNLEVPRGEMVAVVGASGAGKSTLLHLLGALDQPTRGSVRIGGQALAGRSDEALSALRNRSVGFVFQFHHLLREFTALENVMMPLRIAGWDAARARTRARELLERVGLGARVEHKPAALSGGEQQRVAIARAIVNRPRIILADEPTANLDRDSANQVLDALKSFHGAGVTCLISTHDEQFLQSANRVVFLDHGQVTETWRRQEPAQVFA
jgi:ABC-type lipoprotein export system ATPase subunit